MTPVVKTTHIEDIVMQAIAQERRRCIGIVLAEFGVYRLAGAESIARALDAVATKLEYPELMDGDDVSQRL